MDELERRAEWAGEDHRDGTDADTAAADMEAARVAAELWGAW